MAAMLLRVVALLVLLTLAVAGYGEGSRRHDLRATDIPAFEPQLALAYRAVPRPAMACPGTSDEWLKWREDAIRYLVQLDPSTDVLADTEQPQNVRHLDRDRVTKRAMFLTQAMRSCETSLRKQLQAGELQNLRNFVETLSNASYVWIKGKEPVHQFGHDVTDGDYLDAATPALTLPCLLTSQSFLQAMTASATYVKAWQLVKQNETQAVDGCPARGTDKPWLRLVFRSRFLGVPDDSLTRGRFLIVVPGDDYDRWIQFGILTDEDIAEGHQGPVRNVSVVAHSAWSEMGGGPHFDAMADWFRCQDPQCGEGKMRLNEDGSPKNYDPRAPFRPDVPIKLNFRQRLSLETDDCQLCHKTLPLGIHPQSVYQFEPATGKLKAVSEAEASSAVMPLNEKIVSYRRPPVFQIEAGGDRRAASAMYGNVGLAADPTEFGLKQRSTASIRRCSASQPSLSASSVQNVRVAMNCSACHNLRSNGVGTLNYPLATEMRPSALIHAPRTKDDPAPEVHDPNIVQARVMLGSMPPVVSITPGVWVPPNLTPAERTALYDCISREYFDPTDRLHPKGLFIDWLRGQDGSAKGGPPQTLVEEQQ
jgi:hypothetical protein